MNYDAEPAKSPGAGGFSKKKKPTKREDIEYAVDKLLAIADSEKNAGFIDPYDEVIYSVEAKPLQQDSVKLVALKLSKIRELEERLRHIDVMKRSLNKKIRRLQLLKEQENNTKKRIESEVSAAEREWKHAVERLKPGSYEPLDSLGDTSHMY
jgi:hypothetical protein